MYALRIDNTDYIIRNCRFFWSSGIFQDGTWFIYVAEIRNELVYDSRTRRVRMQVGRWRCNGRRCRGCKPIPLLLPARFSTEYSFAMVCWPRANCNGSAVTRSLGLCEHPVPLISCADLSATVLRMRSSGTRARLRNCQGLCIPF